MTKEITVQNVVIGLLVAVAVAMGAYLVRPQAAARTVPLFYGEEVTVGTVAEPVVLAKAETAAKATATPAPVSPAGPLPIVPPLVTFKVLPEYPVSALKQGVQGTVLLSVYVGLTGKAEKIETKLSSGINEFDAAAQQAVAQWRFLPAAQGGSAINSWFELPVSFRISDE
jgi:protein TonB